MPVVIVMLAAAYFSTRTIVAIVAILATLKFIAWRRSSRMRFNYNKENKLFNEFMEKSTISQLKFEPHILAPTPALQGIIYLLAETFHQNFRPDKFNREIIKCPDGGTIGLDWDGDIPDPAADGPQKPIIVICPGLGGDSHNLYSLQLLWDARRAGFKVVTVLFRGAAGLPITTPKLSYSGSWRDAQTAIEFIKEKYVQDPKTKQKRTRLYAFGVSLGAQILGMYLGKAGERAAENLDAALMFATPWSIKKGHKFFYENFYGLYQKVIGLNLNNTIKKHQLPKFESLMDKKEYEDLCRVFDENKTGLDHIDEHVYVKMFGYRDVEHYYDYVSLDNYTDKIAVPLFAFGSVDDQLCGF